MVKDYLQPVLLIISVSIFTGWDATLEQKTGLLVGVVSAVLFLLASYASRQSWRIEEKLGDADRAAWYMTIVLCAVFSVLTVGALVSWEWVLVPLFILFTVIANLWRPIHVGRFDRDGEEKNAATVLSLEAQAKAIAAAVYAPLIGALVDLTAKGQSPAPVNALWPVGLMGIPLMVYAFWTYPKRMNKQRTNE